MSTAPDPVTVRSSMLLRRRWERDEAAFGLWSLLADPVTAELLGTSPFDFICVDLQHGLATFSELRGVVQAMRAAGRAPLVRVPWNRPEHVMRALDTGAAGVVVPMVGSAEEARRAVDACRFPDAGGRSWGPMWGDVLGAAVSPADQDAAALCVVMIETRAGVEALEEIVSVPGVDAVYVGPHDLALGCGFGQRTYRDSLEVDQLIQRITDTCRRVGVVPGLHCSDVEMAVHWAGRGVRMLSAGVDTTLLRQAVDSTWAALGGAQQGVAEPGTPGEGRA